MKEYQLAVERHMADAPLELKEYVCGRLRYSLWWKGVGNPISYCGFEWDESKEGFDFWTQISLKDWQEAIGNDFWKEYLATNMTEKQQRALELGFPTFRPVKQITIRRDRNTLYKSMYDGTAFSDFVFALVWPDMTFSERKQMVEIVNEMLVAVDNRTPSFTIEGELSENVAYLAQAMGCPYRLVVEDNTNKFKLK